MPTQNSDNPAPGPYHHFVPLFVVRRFQDGDDSSISNVTNNIKKETSSNNSLSLNIERTHVFDLSTTILSTRPIDSFYTCPNVSKNGTYSNKIKRVEEDMSRLETKATETTHRLHASLSSSELKLTRLELGLLRKFLFLFHYRSGHRSSTSSSSYQTQSWDPLQDWIRKRKRDRGLKDSMDLWLDGMQYYLDTPHQAIVAEGEGVVQRLGGEMKVEMMKRMGVNPNVNWHALEYMFVANDYFIGFWEAAEGTEFALGNSSFGLWEGLTMDSNYIHRIFVLSPRLILVLRNGVFGLNNPNALSPTFFLKSKLVSIPLQLPQTDSQRRKRRVSRLERIRWFMRLARLGGMCGWRILGRIVWRYLRGLMGLRF
ncbi:hypothetical protein BDQ17DRAFT_1371069 [Cyathus striatus]|nr:hypothetical protein BDQ17DRAFT_1371069 [Cyathus striatus]